MLTFGDVRKICIEIASIYSKYNDKYEHCINIYENDITQYKYSKGGDISHPYGLFYPGMLKEFEVHKGKGTFCDKSENPAFIYGCSTDGNCLKIIKNNLITFIVDKDTVKLYLTYDSSYVNNSPLCAIGYKSFLKETELFIYVNINNYWNKIYDYEDLSYFFSIEEIKRKDFEVYGYSYHLYNKDSAFLCWIENESDDKEFDDCAEFILIRNDENKIVKYGTVYDETIKWHKITW